jgi:hypothetical protein
LDFDHVRLIKRYHHLTQSTSFGSIIYRDQAFALHARLENDSRIGVVHQLCFSMSSLRLLSVKSRMRDSFLSQMASRMVDHCRSRGYDDETMLATVTVGLSPQLLLVASSSWGNYN